MGGYLGVLHSLSRDEVVNSGDVFRGHQSLFAADTASSNRPSMVIMPPDWNNIFNASIYGSGKTDINCITHIVRADMKLRSVLHCKVRL